jgi:hypothetical protein
MTVSLNKSINVQYGRDRKTIINERFQQMLFVPSLFKFALLNKAMCRPDVLKMALQIAWGSEDILKITFTSIKEIIAYCSYRALLDWV